MLGQKTQEQNGQTCCAYVIQTPLTHPHTPDTCLLIRTPHPTPTPLFAITTTPTPSPFKSSAHHPPRFSSCSFISRLLPNLPTLFSYTPFSFSLFCHLAQSPVLLPAPRYIYNSLPQNSFFNSFVGTVNFDRVFQFARAPTTSLINFSLLTYLLSHLSTMSSKFSSSSISSMSFTIQFLSCHISDLVYPCNLYSSSCAGGNQRNVDRQRSQKRAVKRVGKSKKEDGHAGIALSNRKEHDADIMRQKQMLADKKKTESVEMPAASSKSNQQSAHKVPK